MAKKIKAKYEKRAIICHGRVVEIKAATKRSPATMKFIVDPKLADKLMKDSFSSATDDPLVTALTLTWNEKV